MTALSEPHPLQRPLSRRRRAAGVISATLVWAAVAVAVVPLLLVMFTVVKKGGSLITPRFLTDDLPIQARSAQGGVGLGLAIVDAIAKAHGGRCSVRAKENGSVFSLRLPGFDYAGTVALRAVRSEPTYARNASAPSSAT